MLYRLLTEFKYVHNEGISACKIWDKHSTHGTFYDYLKVEWMVLNWICKIKHRMHHWQALVFKVDEKTDLEFIKLALSLELRYFPEGSQC